MKMAYNQPQQHLNRQTFSSKPPQGICPAVQGAAASATPVHRFAPDNPFDCTPPTAFNPYRPRGPCGPRPTWPFGAERVNPVDLIPPSSCYNVADTILPSPFNSCDSMLPRAVNPSNPGGLCGPWPTGTSKTQRVHPCSPRLLFSKSPYDPISPSTLNPQELTLPCAFNPLSSGAQRVNSYERMPASTFNRCGLMPSSTFNPFEFHQNAPSAFNPSGPVPPITYLNAGQQGVKRGGESGSSDGGQAKKKRTSVVNTKADEHVPPSFLRTQKQERKRVKRLLRRQKLHQVRALLRSGDEMSGKQVCFPDSSFAEQSEKLSTSGAWNACAIPAHQETASSVSLGAGAAAAVGPRDTGTLGAQRINPCKSMPSSTSTSHEFRPSAPSAFNPFNRLLRTAPSAQLRGGCCAQKTVNPVPPSTNLNPGQKEAKAVLKSHGSITFGRDQGSVSQNAAWASDAGLHFVCATCKKSFVHKRREKHQQCFDCELSQAKKLRASMDDAKAKECLPPSVPRTEKQESKGVKRSLRRKKQKSFVHAAKGLLGKQVTEHSKGLSKRNSCLWDVWVVPTHQEAPASVSHDAGTGDAEHLHIPNSALFSPVVCDSAGRCSIHHASGSACANKRANCGAGRGNADTQGHFSQIFVSRETLGLSLKTQPTMLQKNALQYLQGFRTTADTGAVAFSCIVFNGLERNIIRNICVSLGLEHKLVKNVGGGKVPAMFVAQKGQLRGLLPAWKDFLLTPLAAQLLRGQSEHERVNSFNPLCPRGPCPKATVATVTHEVKTSATFGTVTQEVESKAAVAKVTHEAKTKATVTKVTCEVAVAKATVTKVTSEVETKATLASISIGNETQPIVGNVSCESETTETVVNVFQEAKPAAETAVVHEEVSDLSDALLQVNSFPHTTPSAQLRGGCCVQKMVEEPHPCGAKASLSVSEEKQGSSDSTQEILGTVPENRRLVTREVLGLHSHSTEADFSRCVYAVLDKCRKRKSCRSLEFSPAFTVRERAIIHKHCRHVGLKYKERVVEGNVSAVVTPVHSIREVLEYILSRGGETQKYKAIPPQCLQTSVVTPHRSS